MTGNTRSTVARVALVAAVVLGAVGCSSSAQDRAGGRGLQEVTVLEIAQLEDGAPPQVEAYAAEVDTQSHGSLRLHFTDSWRKGEVDFERHTLKDVTEGRIQGAWVGVRSLDLIGVSSFQPLVAPLLVDSHAVQDRIFTSGIPAEMARSLQGHGLVALAVLPGPMRKVLGVRKPFREPADFRGAVLGIQGGAVPEATAKALGATFTRMPSGAGLALVDAYEQHVENIFDHIYGLDAKYVTANVNLWPQAMAVVLNETSYRALTPAQRQVLRTAATSAIPPALDATRAEDHSGVVKLCGQHVAFPPASDLQLAELRRTVQPVYDEIAQAPGNARMLDRLADLRAAVAAPPDASACGSRAQDSGGGSFPQGTYEMVLDNDVRSQCTDGPRHGAPGGKTWFSLQVRDGQVAITQRIDSQTAPEESAYTAVYSAFKDKVQIGDLNATWSYDGTALRLRDMTGGSCDTTAIWTTNPWIPRPTAPQKTTGIPDGTYETVLSPADRHLCDRTPEEVYVNPESIAPGVHPRTWYLSFTLDGGAVRQFENEVSRMTTGTLYWAGKYHVYGDTLVLTDLTSAERFFQYTAHRDLLIATFTFDGTTLTLKPASSWPCDARVLWTLHPWTLTKRAK